MVLDSYQTPKKAEDEADDAEKNSVEHRILARQPCGDITAKHGKDASIGKGQEIKPGAPDRLTPTREDVGLLKQVIRE